MEGRYPRAIYWGLSELLDRSREAEFGAWYRRYHIPDSTNTGAFSYATRFVNPHAAEGQGYSLVVYEMHKEMDLFEAWESIWNAPRASQEAHQFDAWRPLGSGVYERIGGEYRAKYNRPVRGVYAVVANCVPGREDEFNAWYEDIHIGDLLETELFHTAYRYKAIDLTKLKGGVESGEYLAIYETELDPYKAEEALNAHRPRLREAGRMSDTIEGVRRFIGYRDWPAG
jgi:hypothetical protein